ncbi:MAG: L-erythro-3,5-diaminohexanoate dehydrogenase, partial [Persicimonas sp.]
MSYRPDGHLYGVHRVVEPVGSLPQAAERLDNSAPAFDNEVTIAVRTLNVDSASFHQIVGEVGRDEAAIGRHIEAIVDERGKMQNPVTGSGGMLIGDVVDVGPRYEGPVELSRGDQVATLVSLTLTPLRIASIEAVRAEADQVEVRGEAYLWPSAPLVVLPDDLPNRLALSVLDVCGAPAQTRRLVEGAERVLVLGMGKSGMLCAAAARDTLGEEALICGF